MGDRVGDAVLVNVVCDVVDVVRQSLKLSVIVLRDAEDEQVQLALIFREPAGDFFADQHIIALGSEREDAVDRVVIGDGDEIHPAAARLGVHLKRIGIALGAMDSV